MDGALGFLTFGTLGFVAAFGYVSARIAARRRAEAKPSTLARDNWQGAATRAR